MDSQWKNLKNKVTNAEGYMDFLNKFSAWSDSVYEGKFSYALLQIKNKLTKSIEISNKFLLNEEKQASGNNNADLQKLKAVDRAFQASAMDGKIMSQCCSFCTDVNNIVKRQEKGEISSTDAAIELLRINKTFLKLEDEYIANLKSFGEIGEAREYVKNIINLTSDTIANAGKNMLVKNDFDLNEFSKINSSIEAIEIPNDPIIQSRIDENKKTFDMIDRTIEEHNVDMKQQGDMIVLEDEVLKTFDALDKAVVDLSEGKDIEANINALYNVALVLSKNVENLQLKQEQLETTQSDYNFISTQFGDAIDKTVDDNIYDYQNYLYDIYGTMLEQVKDISENSQSDTSKQFVKSMSSCMLKMTKLYPSEHAEQTVLATEIEGFVEGLEKGNEKNFDTAEMTKEEPIKSDLSDNISPNNESAENLNNVNVNNFSDEKESEDFNHEEIKNEAVNNEEIKNEDIEEENVNFSQEDKNTNEINSQDEISTEERTDLTSEENPNATNLEKNENYAFSDILSESDLEILNSTIKELRKYDWVKHTLINDGNIHISQRFREALERDELKGEIDKMCAEQPPFNTEEELPFARREEMEIRNIIESLCRSGVSKEDIVRTAAYEIKTNASEELKDTWQTLSAKFDGSHKYFYLAREYLKDVASEVMKDLNLEKDEGMER